MRAARLDRPLEGLRRQKAPIASAEKLKRKIKDAMEAAREEGKRKGAEGGQMNVPQFVDFSV